MTDDNEKVNSGGQTTTIAIISPTTDSGLGVLEDTKGITDIGYIETSTATEFHRKTEAILANPVTDHRADSSPYSKETDSDGTTLTVSFSTEWTSSSVYASDNNKTDSSGLILPVSVSGEVQVNDKGKYGVWNSSQRALLQVAIISLAILCAVCFTVCAIMIVLFFIACRRRNAPPQGYYRKVPFTEKDQDLKLSETKELGIRKE